MKIFNPFIAGAILAALMVCPARATGPDGVLNTVYRVDSQPVQLTNGRAEAAAAPGSAAKVVTQVVNGPVFGDLDGDGQSDAALFLSQTSGGSGTFCYVAAAIKKNGRWKGTNAVFIGDRVVPQTIRIGDGVIVIQYLDRRPEESMAVTPSVKKNLEIELVGGHLEVLQP